MDVYKTSDPVLLVKLRRNCGIHLKQLKYEDTQFLRSFAGNLKNCASIFDNEAGLLEQIRLLTIENETLRQFIAEEGLPNALQEKGKKLNEEVQQKKIRRRSHAGSGKIKSPNVSTPHTPVAGGKGCSCKGNCSTRVCGCVKKNVPCAEFCRCGDELCQNSEPDKENINDPNKPPLSKDGQESLAKLSKLTITGKEESKKNPAGLSSVNKQLEKVIKPRSIFSPDIDEDVFTFENGATKEDDLAKEEDKAEETKQSTAKRSKNKNNKKANNTEAVKEEGNALDPDEAVDDDVELEPRKKTKAKADKKKKATRAASEVASPDNEQAESDPETTNKNKKTAKKGKATEMKTNFEDSYDSKPSPTDSTDSNNRSFETSALLHPEGAEGFNPMKPRRQLLRSPTGPRTELDIQTTLKPSEILLPISIKTELDEVTVPPPSPRKP